MRSANSCKRRVILTKNIYGGPTICSPIASPRIGFHDTMAMCFVRKTLITLNALAA